MLGVSAMLIRVSSLWQPSPCAGGQLEERLPVDVSGLRWPALTCYANRACLHIWALGNTGANSRRWAEEAGLARTLKESKNTFISTISVMHSFLLLLEL